jgi:hypothetical protein
MPSEGCDLRRRRRLGERQAKPRKLVQMQGRDVLCAPYDKLCLVDRKYEDVLNFGVDQLNRTVARRDVKVTQTETLRRTRLPATQ